MRILIVSYAFPPFNVMGAVRLGHTAAWLRRFGHEVRVLTADDQPFDRTLAIDLDDIRVTYTRWLDVYRPARAAAMKAAGASTPVAGGAPNLQGRVRAGVRRAVSTLVNFPDPEIGWYPFAVRAGRRMLRDWRPSLIYSSGKPFTSLLVARTLARHAGVPWVAELRDLWSDNHYRNYSRLRDVLDRTLEKKTLGAADGLVSVSEPLTEVLAARYRKSAIAVLNGFDTAAPAESQEPPSSPDHLEIVYTGIIYPGRRDPSNLFRAISLLGKDAERVTVSFYGKELGKMLAPSLAIAEAAGVAHRVRIEDAVPHGHAIALQRRADVLLLLTWDHPDEVRLYPGKLFEYIGAGRPILALGCTTGVAAGLIRSRALGLASNGPDEIADQLRSWLSQKQSTGMLPGPPKESVAGLSRGEQVRRLESFFEQVVRHD